MFGSKPREIAMFMIVVASALAAAAPTEAHAANANDTFVFEYRASELRDVQTFRNLDARLRSEASRYCRTRSPDGRSPVTQLGCRRSVVESVRASLIERAPNDVLRDISN
jgi:UrcA family protein